MYRSACTYVCMYTLAGTSTQLRENRMKHGKRRPWHAPLVHLTARADKKKNKGGGGGGGMERRTHTQRQTGGRGQRQEEIKNERENAYKTEESKATKEQRKRSVFLEKEIPQGKTGGEEIRVRKGEEQPASKRGLPEGVLSTSQTKGPPSSRTDRERGGETCALA